MSEIKKSLIDMILEGKEELMKAARAPFIKAANKRASASARDNARLEVNNLKLQQQKLFEDVQNYPSNLSALVRLEKQIQDSERNIEIIESIHKMYFGKALPAEMDVD